MTERVKYEMTTGLLTDKLVGLFRTIDPNSALESVEITAQDTVRFTFVPFEEQPGNRYIKRVNACAGFNPPHNYEFQVVEICEHGNRYGTNVTVTTPVYLDFTDDQLDALRDGAVIPPCRDDWCGVAS